LVTSDEIRHLAGERVPSHQVKRAAMAAGMRTLRHDGWRKVLNGLTTIDEVMRVTGAD
jgi:type II secretory ATPase GspE/PulE/Tfp pilus assembly ATPase PilB-like protein